jgi:hypothetical protein
MVEIMVELYRYIYIVHVGLVYYSRKKLLRNSIYTEIELCNYNSCEKERREEGLGRQPGNELKGAACN